MARVAPTIKKNHFVIVRVENVAGVAIEGKFQVFGGSTHVEGGHKSKVGKGRNRDLAEGRHHVKLAGAWTKPHPLWLGPHGKGIGDVEFRQIHCHQRGTLLVNNIGDVRLERGRATAADQSGQAGR
jgi:hypothetical protein